MTKDEAPPTRISADPTHPWFRPDFAEFTVTLHGQEVAVVVTCDAEAGVVWGYERGKDGKRLIVEPATESFAIIRRHGPFKIERRAT